MGYGIRGIKLKKIQLFMTCSKECNKNNVMDVLEKRHISFKNQYFV